MGLGAIAGVVGAAASVGSSIIGDSAAGDAANAQRDAANTAAQTQLSMYNSTKQTLAPFTTAGSNAFSQLASIFGFGGSNSTGVPNMSGLTSQLEQTPGYQFTLGQGTQALDRSAASRGLDLSGGQLKDLTGYGQGLAMSNAWQPYVSELNSAASLGENAGAATGNLGASAASGAAQSQLAAGQAQASGIVSQGNILGSGLNQFANSFNSPALGSSYGSGGLSGQYTNSFGALTAGIDPSQYSGAAAYDPITMGT